MRPPRPSTASRPRPRLPPASIIHTSSPSTKSASTTAAAITRCAWWKADRSAASLLDGPLPPERTARLLATVARAIHHAHERGVLHRDLKPANILMDTAGEPHVSDFGLAKITHREQDLTLTHQTIGTPAYMSPEQASGRAREVTTAADIYGLGAVLYETLSGHPPFRVKPRWRLPAWWSRRSLRRPVPITAPCPPTWRSSASSASKDPSRRYPTAAAFADHLERWLKNEPIEARPAAPVDHVVKWVRRHPALAALTGSPYRCWWWVSRE